MSEFTSNNKNKVQSQQQQHQQHAISDKVLWGAVMGAAGGALFVLAGNAYSIHKKNKFKYKGVETTNINDDKYIAVRLFELQNLFGDIDERSIIDIIENFDNLIDIYYKTFKEQKQYYSWKASQYDQEIQAKFLELNRHVIANNDIITNKMNSRRKANNNNNNNYNNSDNDNKNLLNDLRILTDELRKSSTAYVKHIIAGNIKH